MRIERGLAVACAALLLLTRSAGAVGVADILADPATRQALLAEARATMAAFIGLSSHPDDRLLARLRQSRAAAFVTLEVDGKVRGCRGTLDPVTPSLLDEVRRNAVAAATHDPRFAPIRPAELKRARISVTVVVRLEPIPSSEIDRLGADEGLVVRCGDRVGVVLPYEGRDPQQRLAWGYQKAGLSRLDACDLFRMTAVRFAEEPAR